MALDKCRQVMNDVLQTGDEGLTLHVMQEEAGKTHPANMSLDFSSVVRLHFSH